MLTHESRQLPSWLIFDVSPKMESLAKIVDLLGDEMKKSGPSLSVAQRSSLARGKKTLIDESVDREIEFRAAVDVACAEFATSLRWPPLESIPAVLAQARVVEAYHFGRWLMDSPVELKRMPAQHWLTWLLVDFWRSMGWNMFYRRWRLFDE